MLLLLPLLSVSYPASPPSSPSSSSSSSGLRLWDDGIFFPDGQQQKVVCDSDWLIDSDFNTHS